MRYILPILLALSTFCSAQTPTGNNKAWVDSLWMDKDGTFANMTGLVGVDDTTDLKTLNGLEGTTAYLKQLASGNTNGGGWFVVVDSSDHGSILTTAMGGINWFEHPTTDRVWLRSDYLHSKVLMLRPDMTRAEVNRVFTEVDNSTVPVVLKFQPGEYTWRGDPYYNLRGVDRLFVDMRGALIDMDDRAFIITTHPIGFQDNGKGGWFGAWHHSFGIKGGDDFTTSIMKDSVWIGVKDTTDWADIEFGDMVVLCDSTEYMYETTGINGYIGFFDRFETNSQGADSGRMVFKNPAFSTVDPTILGAAKWIDVGLDTDESIDAVTDPITFTVDGTITTQIIPGYHIKIDSEVMFVTAISGTEVTATRSFKKATHLTNVDIDYGRSDIYSLDLRDKICTVEGGVFRNGNLRIIGFDVINTSNTFFYLDSSAIPQDYTNNYATAALQVQWSRSVNIVNHFANNYFITALGYGLTAGICHTVNIANFTALDCRHAFTTSAVNGNTVDGIGCSYIRMQNVVALTSKSGRTNISSSAFDTHRGTRYFEIDGFYIENSEYGFQLRAEEIIIRNGKFRSIDNQNYPGNTFCILGSSSISDEEEYRKNCTIENVDINSVRSIVTIGEGTRMGRIDMDNVKAWSSPELNVNYLANGFLVHTAESNDSVSVDSFTVTNSDFFAKGNGIGEKYFIQNQAGVAQDSLRRFKYFSFDNNTVTGFEYFLYAKKWFIDDFNITNSTISDLRNGFMRVNGDTTVDSTNVIMDNFLIKGNMFKNTVNLLGMSYTRYDNIEISGNTFDGLGNLLNFSTASYIGDDIIFSNNTIKNSLTDQPMIKTATGGSWGNGTLVHTNNTYLNGLQQNMAIWEGTGTYRPTLFYKGNDFPVLVYSAVNTAMFDVDSANLVLMDNYIKTPSSTARRHSIVSMDGDSDIEIIDNYIHYTDNFADTLLHLYDADVNLIIKGNTILNYGTGSDVILSADAAGTILSGINETNEAVPLDTTGWGGTWETMIKFGE